MSELGFARKPVDESWLQQAVSHLSDLSKNGRWWYELHGCGHLLKRADAVLVDAPQLFITMASPKAALVVGEFPEGYSPKDSLGVPIVHQRRIDASLRPDLAGKALARFLEQYLPDWERQARLKRRADQAARRRADTLAELELAGGAAVVKLDGWRLRVLPPAPPSPAVGAVGARILTEGSGEIEVLEDASVRIGGVKGIVVPAAAARAMLEVLQRMKCESSVGP